VLNAFAAIDLLKDERLFVQAVDGDDDRYRFADRLFSREAKEPLRAGVPARITPLRSLDRMASSDDSMMAR
jgi:hypothetical protein